ncbi:hypothetical protein [Prosthecobacter vanneervenii]|uniref:Uncharacterized protein n=1 Tax=Prosthecobacter vanneervenii TaxID=48466 RepID=A0A7W7Y8I0_9BACT|nr:hypothetical protein [Prosthecobacter vanneervenii]MBB5031435.1 hypothetical protein [Prosthecobacter vanneervenii]
MIIPLAPNSHFQAPAPYYAEAGPHQNTFSWAALYALDTACSLLGCRHAWVTSHAADACHIVLRREQTMEIGAGLEELILRQAETAAPDSVQTVPWAGGMLLFAGLSFGLAADGRKYVLGMQFENVIEMTERRAGVLDGLRCSLQTYLGRLRPAAPQPADPETLATAAPGSQPVTCCCCRKVHTPQHGWMHWDDLRLMTTGRGSSHTVCEKCADELYSDVLQNGL